MIDLHTHSNISDGSLSPEALAALAADSELSAVALTDHDTIEGTDRFCRACTANGLRGIAGVEISADVPAGTMHILGYFLEAADTRFARVLQQIRNGRKARNVQILETLARLGMPLEMSALLEVAGEGVVGRPHMAAAMVAAGYVPDSRAAFDRFLGKGKPAYHDRFRLAPAEAIRAITMAGGVAVLAHPWTLGRSPKALGELVGMLAGAGLGGLEVIYPEHPDPLRQLYKTLAKAHGLVVTGGSDYHGALNPAIRLGRGFGNVKVPDQVLVALEARRPTPRWYSGGMASVEAVEDS